MAVEITGFAEALIRCEAFNSVDASVLEKVLASGEEPLEIRFVEPLNRDDLIRSGSPFKHLYFIRHGKFVSWQYPYSELSSPFLLGEQEFMMNAKHWVATYSPLTQATIVGIPVATMTLIVEQFAKIRDQMNLVLLRRMARYYWISLATNGSPASRVAAALISRLALVEKDHGHDREISLRQGDITRLTVMSRSAVSAGIATLTSEDVIHFGTNQERFSGEIHVPDVHQLKRYVFNDVWNKHIHPLHRQDKD